MFSIIARWRLFKKMGYKGWTFIVPFYSDFCLFEALYGSGWRMIQPYWVIPVIIMLSSLISTMTREYVLLVLGIMAIVVYVMYFVISFAVRLSNSFGKDGLWTLGTLMFLPIFMIVYGISDLRFLDKPYPDVDNYDAIDGFIDFFRSQSSIGKKNNSSNTHKRFCPNCGTPASANARFCNECGTPIEE